MHFPSAFLSLEQFADNSDAIREFFSNPKLDEEFPTAKEDMANLVAMESYVERLVDFDGRLRTAGGINRGLALELKELVPDLEGFNPLAYTQDITAIRYHVSLEELSGKMWALIAATVAVVIGLIYKVVNWLTGGSSGGGGGGGGGSISDAQAGLKEAQKNIQEQARIAKKAEKDVNAVPHSTSVVQVPATQSHDAIKNSHIPSSIKDDLIRRTHDTGRSSNHSNDGTVQIEIDLKKELQEIESRDVTSHLQHSTGSYAFIMFGKGGAVDVVDDSFRMFGQVVADLQSNIEELDAYITKVDTEGPQGWEKDQDWNKATDHFAQREHVVGHQIAKDELTWHLRLKEVLANKEGYNAMPAKFQDAMAQYSERYELIANVEWQNLEKFFPTLKDAEKSLEKCKERIDAYRAKTKTEDRFTPENGAYFHLKEAFGKIHTRINALMVVYSTLTKVYSDVALLGFDLLKGFHAHTGRLIAFFRKYDQPVPEDLQNIHDSIGQGITDWKSVPVHRRFLLDTAWERRQR